MSRLIVLTHATVTAEEIYIATESTSYFNERSIQLSWADLDAAYSELRKQLKDAGVRVVHKYSTASKIRALKDTLPQALAAYQAHYDALRNGIQPVLERGLSAPTRDDAELNALYKHSHAMHNACAHSEPIGKLFELMSMIERIKTSNLTNTSTAYL